MSRQNDRTPEQSGKKGGRQKNTPVEPGSAASAPHKKRVTLADIARHAGVSTTAVSFTLSERLDMLLAEATRKRIKQSAKELGYVTNRLSEGFFHGRSKLIGIL